MAMKKQLTLGVLLPHTKLYGGVKRFLELGNEFVKSGHRFIVFTPKGEAPDWFRYEGQCASFEEIGREPLDALFTTTVRFMPLIMESQARHKIFYHVRKTEKIKHIASDPESEIYACSGNVWSYDRKKYPGKQIVKAFGGVNTGAYSPVVSYARDADSPLVVMAYGRLAEKVKGTRYVVKACERLYKKGYNIKLLLYDTPMSEKAKKLIENFKCKCPHEFVVGHPFERNSELFSRADVFVSAENAKYSGWNNTVAEAMATHLPVVATEAGTADLIIDRRTGLLCRRRSKDIAAKIAALYDSETLRQQLGREAGRHIRQFDWSLLASRIVKELENDE